MNKTNRPPSYKSFNLIRSFALIFALSSQAQSQVGLAVAVNGPLDSPKTVKQVAESKNISQLIRSNSTQFWAWAKDESPKFFSKEALSIEGWVVGDPHNKNFGPLKYQDSVRWSLIDFDDAGKGPLLLDFARFVAASKAVTAEIKTKDIWSAYISGLRGENPPSSHSLNEYLNMKPQDYRNLQVSKTKKFLNGNKLTNDGSESTEITDPKLKLQITAEFKKLLPNLQILDVGGREKDRGGSQEALRFVALVQGEDGKNSIFELKENLGTALSSYKKQTDSFAATLAFFVQRQDPKQDFRYQATKFDVGTKSHEFLLRPKQLYFFDYANEVGSKKDLPLFFELSIFNAWFQGRLHGSQPAGKILLAAIQADTQDKILDGVKDTAKGYIDYMANFLQKKSKK